MTKHSIDLKIEIVQKYLDNYYGINGLSSKYKISINYGFI